MTDYWVVGVEALDCCHALKLCRVSAQVVPTCRCAEEAVPTRWFAEEEVLTHWYADHTTVDRRTDEQSVLDIQTA